MSLIDTARQALTEIPISDVLRERLSLALDEATALERKVSEFQGQVAELKAELKITKTHEKQTEEELQRLKKEHEEEIVVLHGLEFRRGKRTQNKWIPFCPKCHVAAVIPHFDNRPVICQDQDCNWVSNAMTERFHGLESQLPA